MISSLKAFKMKWIFLCKTFVYLKKILQYLGAHATVSGFTLCEIVFAGQDILNQDTFPVALFFRYNFGLMSSSNQLMG